MKPARKKQGLSPMDAALRFLAAKPRTVREVEERLDSLDFGEGDIYQVVARLLELGLLNDEAFASDFVATRLATKPLSRRKLREQLFARKVPGDLVDAAVASIDDVAEAANALLTAKKYKRQFEALEGEEQKRRVMLRLVGRGFAYEASRAAIEMLFGDAQGLLEIEASGGDAEDDD